MNAILRECFDQPDRITRVIVAMRKPNEPSLLRPYRDNNTTAQNKEALRVMKTPQLDSGEKF
jgi:hypothetical protein